MKLKNLFDKTILILSVSIAFYLTIILMSDFSKLEKIQLELNYLPLIVSLLVLHVILAGFKYHRMLKKLNIKIPFIDTQKIYLAGFALALTPGGFGTAAIKSRLLKKKFGSSISSTILVLYVERWTELIAILIVLSFLLFFAFAFESLIILIVGSFVAVVFSIVITNTMTFNSIKKIFLKIKYFKKINSNIEDSRQSFVILSKKSTFLEALFYSVIIRIIRLFAVYFIFLMMGIDLGFFESGIIYYTSILAGNLSLIPAGIIVTESGMIAMLLKYNIEFSVATLAVVIIRFLVTWSLAIVGTIGYQIVVREQVNFKD